MSTSIPPRFALRAALAIRAAIFKLVDRFLPPQVRAIELGAGYQTTMLMRAAARFRVADLLASGPKSAGELARAIGNVEVDALHRTLRALATQGVFELGADGRFRNNRISEVMREGVPSSVHAWVMYSGSKSNFEAWADYERTVETGKNAFERVHGKDFWSYFGDHPDEGQTFAQAMVELTDIQAPAIAATYPFSDFKTICDVAGGRGTLLAWILERHPKVRAWLFDEQYVLDESGAFLASRGIADRVELKPGNMFVEIPRGADAYVLKDIIHDWDDARSLKILENCRRAMDPGQKLLLVEMVVEPNSTESPGPLLDAHMMITTCEGRQRSEEDYRRLFERTGFKLQRIVLTPVPASVVEVVAV